MTPGQLVICWMLGFKLSIRLPSPIWEWGEGMRCGSFCSMGHWRASELGHGVLGARQRKSGAWADQQWSLDRVKKMESRNQNSKDGPNCEVQRQLCKMQILELTYWHMEIDRAKTNEVDKLGGSWWWGSWAYPGRVEIYKSMLETLFMGRKEQERTLWQQISLSPAKLAI